MRYLLMMNKEELYIIDDEMERRTTFVKSLSEYEGNYMFDRWYIDIKDHLKRDKVIMYFDSLDDIKEEYPELFI